MAPIQVHHYLPPTPANGSIILIHGGGPKVALISDDDYLNDLAEIVAYTTQHFGFKPFLFGHSMGGLIAAEFAYKNIKPLAGLILSAPRFSLYLNLMQKLLLKLLKLTPHLRVPTPINPNWLTHNHVANRLYIENPLVQKTITASIINYIQINIPILLFVAGSDKIVSPNGSQLFFQHAQAQHIQQIWLDHAFREIFNEAPIWRDQAISELNHWLLTMLPIQLISQK
ncbi:hypothetical protein ACTFIZ_007606 [Dictyostelium cf. discoideum]